ncbi:MAG: ral secretion pathway protein [Xanthomonadaceae bacterium]|nr:ral secretion pathway protein [Xanthomonadaceae bacterium]
MANSNRPASRAGRADGLGHPVTRRSIPRGFTLLEIILVMAIIALASVLAAAAMGGGFRGMQLGASAKQIASNLRFTRAQAIATGKQQQFVIDPHAHQWRAPKSRHGDIPPKLGIAFIGAREVQPRGGEGAIAFFPDGASTGGRIQLSSGKAMWTVNVAWLTGQVEITHGTASQ